MSEATTKLKSCETDIPPASVYREYDQRKAEIFREHGHGVEYDRAVRELIDELGV